MPSLGDVAQIITALAAVGALILSWRNNVKIEAVHIATNSLTDRLIATTRLSLATRGIGSPPWSLGWAAIACWIASELIGGLGRVFH